MARAVLGTFAVNGPGSQKIEATVVYDDVTEDIEAVIITNTRRAGRNRVIVDREGAPAERITADNTDGRETNLTPRGWTTSSRLSIGIFG